jgi:hypothetical protein
LPPWAAVDADDWCGEWITAASHAGQSCANCSYYILKRCQRNSAAEPKPFDSWIAVDATDWCGMWNVTPVLAAPFTASPITNSLGADVVLNNTALYFDGPSIAQGTTGTWFVSGTVTINSIAQADSLIHVKLWDGTNVIASAYTENMKDYIVVALSGYITSPAGNLRISARDSFRTSRSICYNASGNSKDSTITAFRIA